MKTPCPAPIRLADAAVLGAALIALAAAEPFTAFGALTAAEPLAAQQPTAPDPAAVVDSLMADYGPDTPGGVVAVVRGGEVIFAKGYGLANLEHRVPMTRETVMDIGSVAKQLTGFAVALLVDRGELSLDDDIRTYLPEVPDFGHTITVRHLLHHTSGLREIYNANSLAGWRGGDGLTQEDALHLTSRMTELNFEPGTRYLYCNTGYMLLADIVAEVSGMPFPEFMAENVFGPLGMTHTTIMDIQGKVIPGAAESYGRAPDSDDEEGVTRYARIFDNSTIMGAGGIYTTVDDLAAWMTNLGSGEVGGPGVQALTRQRGVLADGDTLSYAFGINVGEWRGQPMLGHGGSSAGYRASLTYFPDIDAGVVVQSNYAGFDGDVSRAVAGAFFGAHLAAEDEEESADAAGADAPSSPGPPASDAPVAVDEAVLEAYVGKYELQPGAVISITLDDGRLFGQPTGQSREPLVPTSDSTFVVVDEAVVSFNRDEDGAVIGMTLAQDTQRRRLTRLPDWSPSAAELSALEGRYYSPELETVYTLEVRDGTLTAHHRRHPDFELTPIEPDVFSGASFFGTARVERNEAGEVTGLRVSNGRVVDLWFERMGGGSPDR